MTKQTTLELPSRIRQQAKIKTSGVNKTTPNLGRNPNNVKVPLYGFRGYRDPKTHDLTFVEQKALEAEEEAKRLQGILDQRKKEAEDKSKAEQIEAAVNLRLAEAEAKKLEDAK